MQAGRLALSRLRHIGEVCPYGLDGRPRRGDHRRVKQSPSSYEEGVRADRG